MLKRICYTAIALLSFCDINAEPPPYATSTSNQQLVADQIETLKPITWEIFLLETLSQMDVAPAEKIFDQMSGQQYTSLFTSTEIINRQFIRRLYDPLRFLISNPCSCNEEVYELCSSRGIDAWAEGSGGRSFLDGNKNAQGFKMSGYEVSIGAQKRFTPCWTFGAGGCYAMNHIDYNVGGGSKINTVLGAVYALYRPEGYYALADVTFGSSKNDIHRRVNFNLPQHDYLLKNKPNISQVAFYGEAGFDWLCNCVLVQPFVGLEANRFKRSCGIDHGYAPLRLIYSKKEITNAYSRLGFHLTTPENCYDLTFAFDLAWQYRLNSAHNSLEVRFDKFGTPFTITGIPDERNSLGMGFTVWSEIFEGWTMYLEASGERWKRVSTYVFTGGLFFKW
jgi:outer membrane autotransporter protein